MGGCLLFRYEKEISHDEDAWISFHSDANESLVSIQDSAIQLQRKGTMSLVPSLCPNLHSFGFKVP